MTIEDLNLLAWTVTAATVVGTFIRLGDVVDFTASPRLAACRDYLFSHYAPDPRWQEALAAIRDDPRLKAAGSLRT